VQNSADRPWSWRAVHIAASRAHRFYASHMNIDEFKVSFGVPANEANEANEAPVKPLSIEKGSFRVFPCHTCHSPS